MSGPYQYPLYFEGRKSANFAPAGRFFANFGTFKPYNFRIAKGIANLKLHTLWNNCVWAAITWYFRATSILSFL